ncbi:hypothetical protein BDZ97DRAFT_1764030, partial [Flammula alnicola]
STFQRSTSSIVPPSSQPQPTPPTSTTVHGTAVRASLDDKHDQLKKCEEDWTRCQGSRLLSRPVGMAQTTPALPLTATNPPHPTPPFQAGDNTAGTKTHRNLQTATKHNADDMVVCEEGATLTPDDMEEEGHEEGDGATSTVNSREPHRNRVWVTHTHTTTLQTPTYDPNDPKMAANPPPPFRADYDVTGTCVLQQHNILI